MTRFRSHIVPLLAAALWCGGTAARAQGVVRQTAGDAAAGLFDAAPAPGVTPSALPPSLLAPAVFAELPGDPAAPPPAAAAPLALPAALDPEKALSPGGLTGTLKILGLLTVLSLAPSILIMTSCFVRFVVVFGLLKQAIGAQQLPPNQVVVALCLFLTAAVMGPVWAECYDAGVRPYTDPAPGEVPPTAAEAFDRTAAPLRAFMADQIERTGNSAAVRLFLDYRRPAGADPDTYPGPQTYEEVPLGVLVPAYMLSELKTAFVIGFQIYLPFLVIDLVVSAVLISMGMMMLPPVLISLPFKLLLFVLADGWFLTVGMLMESVRPL